MRWVQLCSSLSILLSLPFFGIGMKTELFQSCGHCWVFQICWHIECSTLTTSSFRIWNSSTGIPSPPLALFVVILAKAHLTSHSRMSGSRSVITPSWLSGSWRSFLYRFMHMCVGELTAYILGFCGETQHTSYWKWWWHCGQDWSDHSESVVLHLGATGFEKEPSYTITFLGTSPVWWVPWSMASDQGTLVWKVED